MLKLLTTRENHRIFLLKILSRVRLLHYYWPPKIQYHWISDGISIIALMDASLIINATRGLLSKTLSSHKFPFIPGFISTTSNILLIFLLILFVFFFYFLLVFVYHILEGILGVVSLFLNTMFILLRGDEI